MGRYYAGVLGPLAFGTLVFRGLIYGGSIESTLQMACLGLFAFAAIGFVAGQIASTVVEDSVRTKFALELQSQEKRTEVK